jgi:hypothetical protein
MRADFESRGVTIIKTDVYEKASEASTVFKEHPFFKIAFGSGFHPLMGKRMLRGLWNGSLTA